LGVFPEITCFAFAVSQSSSGYEVRMDILRLATLTAHASFFPLAGFITVFLARFSGYNTLST
jgi:hypothetical protein